MSVPDRLSIAGNISKCGSLIAISRIVAGRVWVLCRHCGKEKRVHAGRMYAPRSRSCGCLNPGAGPGVRAAALRPMIARGLTVREMSESLGIRESSVRGLIRRNKLPAPVNMRGLGLAFGSHKTPEQRAAAVARANQVGAAAAADEFGVHERSIVRWRNGHTQRVWA